MRYYGPDNIDKIIYEKYLNYSDGVFIEVGGYDGLLQSNTAHAEFYKNWTGLLVEPTNIFNQMVNNRPKSICENYVLVSNINEKDYIDIYDFGPMSVIDGVYDYNDIFKNTIPNRIPPNKKPKDFSYNVKAIKLSELLSKHKFTTIDFMSLDTEGSELDILKGMDIEKYSPKYILIENSSKCFDSKNENKEGYNFLKKYGYDIIDYLSWDILYKKLQ